MNNHNPNDDNNHNNDNNNDDDHEEDNNEEVEEGNVKQPTIEHEEPSSYENVVTTTSATTTTTTTATRGIGEEKEKEKGKVRQQGEEEDEEEEESKEQDYNNNNNNDDDDDVDDDGDGIINDQSFLQSANDDDDDDDDEDHKNKNQGVNVLDENNKDDDDNDNDRQVIVQRESSTDKKNVNWVTGISNDDGDDGDDDNNNQKEDHDNNNNNVVVVVKESSKESILSNDISIQDEEERITVEEEEEGEEEEEIKQKVVCTEPTTTTKNEEIVLNSSLTETNCNDNDDDDNNNNDNENKVQRIEEDDEKNGGGDGGNDENDNDDIVVVLEESPKEIAFPSNDDTTGEERVTVVEEEDLAVNNSTEPAATTRNEENIMIIPNSPLIENNDNHDDNNHDDNHDDNEKPVTSTEKDEIGGGGGNDGNDENEAPDNENKSLSFDLPTESNITIDTQFIKDDKNKDDDDDDDEKYNSNTENTKKDTLLVAPSTPKHSPTNKQQQEQQQMMEDVHTPGLTPIKRSPLNAHHYQQRYQHQQSLPSLSECLYGVPEDDDIWDDFFSTPINMNDNNINNNNNNNNNNNEMMDNKNNDMGGMKINPITGYFDDGDGDGDDEENKNRYYELLLWNRQARVRGHEINVSHLRRLAAIGIPDEGSHRGVVWRILLGPLLPPNNIDDWSTIVYKKRLQYKTLCKKHFLWNDWNFGHVLRVKRKQQQQQNNKKKQNYYGPLSLRLDTTDDAYQAMNLQVTDGDDDDNENNIASNDNNDDDEDDNNNGNDNNTTQQNEEEQSTIPTRPQSFDMFNNPNVLKDIIPQSVQDAWTERGKDLHILETIQTSFNALQLPSIDDHNEINNFITSAILLDEIHKDVVRTHSDLAFFLDPNDDLGKRRYAVIERILFLWVTFNELNVKYVQGMNEIVGALYYVCANDVRTEWSNFAEADAYWLFHALLIDMRDVFIPELDMGTSGIQGKLNAFQHLLTKHDPVVNEHLMELGIDASFYAMRWLTTLLSREFLLPDTIRLWDSMFASTNKDNFLRYVCVTMIFLIRDELLQGDFGTCIKLLQNYPTVQMDLLLESSRALYFYETQITLACRKANISQHTALLQIPSPPTIIMAFGFQRGTPPMPTLSSKERINNATTAIATSTKRVFRKMIRMWSSNDDDENDNNNNNNNNAGGESGTNNNNNNNNNNTTSLSQSSVTSPASLPTMESNGIEHDIDDIYMEAILGIGGSNSS